MIWVGDFQLLSVFPVIAFLIGFIVLLSIGHFTLYHIRLVLFNMTTLEYEELYKSTERVVSNRWRVVHAKYDRGYVGNFQQVFGEEWYNWFIPTLVDGDGTFYNVVAEG